MEVKDVIENLNKEFRSIPDEVAEIRLAFACEVCFNPGFIEIKGDYKCYECGNTITLCLDCAKELHNTLGKFIIEKEKELSECT